MREQGRMEKNFSFHGVKPNVDFQRLTCARSTHHHGRRPRRLLDYQCGKCAMSSALMWGESRWFFVIHFAMAFLLSICHRSHALNLALMMSGLAALGGVDGIGFFDNFNMFTGSCLGKAFESFVLDEVESWRSFSSSQFKHFSLYQLVKVKGQPETIVSRLVFLLFFIHVIFIIFKFTSFLCFFKKR